MEILAIIFLLVVMGGSYPIVWEVLGDGQIRGRTVKVVKSNLNRRKHHVPGIVTADMRALKPRNKDWGPDGKLTQMWEDAFEYWQLKDPKGTLESYRIKQHEWEQKRDELKAGLENANAMYDKHINRHDIYAAADDLGDISKLRTRLSGHGTGPRLTADERVMDRLAKRYGTEVYYNNDMVRLSAQRDMPTFDYIALTSV